MTLDNNQSIVNSIIDPTVIIGNNQPIINGDIDPMVISGDMNPMVIPGDMNPMVIPADIDPIVISDNSDATIIPGVIDRSNILLFILSPLELSLLFKYKLSYFRFTTINLINQ